MKNFLKTTFFLLIGLLLVWLVVRNLSESDKVEILASFKKADYKVIFLVALIGFASHVSRAIRWQTLLEPLGIKPSFKNTFSGVLVAYLANLAVPRLGEVSRCGILKRYEGIAFESAFGTVITERIIDTFSLLIVSIITVVWQFDLLADILKGALHSKGNNGEHGTVYWVMIALLALTIIGVVVFYLYRNKIKNMPLYKKVIDALKGFLQGIKTVSQLKRPWVFLFHSVLIWVLYLAAIYVGFNSLEQSSHLGLGAAFSILFFGTFAFVLVQGGIGAYQIIVQNTLLIYGISANTGYALGWLLWGTQTLTVVVFGILALILLPIINTKKDGLTASN